MSENTVFSSRNRSQYGTNISYSHSLPALPYRNQKLRWPTMNLIENMTFENSTSPENAEFTIYLSAYVLQGLSAFLCITTNSQITVVLTKLRKTSLSSKTYIFILHLAIADFTVGLSYGTTCIKRIYCMLTTGYDCGATQLLCAMQIAPLLFGINASMVFSFILGIDRLAAVTHPLSYRTLQRYHYHLIAAAAWLYTSIEVGSLFIGVSAEKQLNRCTVMVTVTNGYTTWNAYYSLIMSILTLTLYGTLMIKTRNAKKVSKNCQVY